MRQWKESLIRYFASGIKKENRKLLGLEAEHFIVEKETGKAVPYEGQNGIRRILEELMAVYPDAEPIREEDLLGFTVPDFSITLEPAAQFEISIKALEEIESIGRIYSGWRAGLEKILEAHGYALLNTGCQPESSVESIEMIPKQRYALMNRSFAKHGTGGMEMMRGTASVQVSVDYTSEEDFREKIQAAYFYGPVFKMLCDNAPSFQGKPADKHLLRTDIWRRVDPSRCGVLPGIFSPGYSFSDYADFAGAVAPIFLKKDGKIIPTGEKTVAEIFENTAAEEEDVLHIISMVFPDVRLKHFLELRFADSVQLPFMLAYCSMVKGLIYSREGLDYAQEQIRSLHLSGEDILKAEDECMEKGWDGMVYDKTARQQAQILIALAQKNLGPEEKKYPEAFIQAANGDNVTGTAYAGEEIFSE